MAHSKAAFMAEHLLTIGASHILGFIPMDDDGLDIIRAASRSGKPVMISVHTARNTKHHRLLFAVFQKLVEGGVIDWDVDRFIDWAKSAAGLVETWWDHKGRVQYRPKSISFESMSQDQFTRFFDRVIYQIFRRLLGDGRSEGWRAFRDEIVEMIDGDIGKRAKEQR